MVRLPTLASPDGSLPIGLDIKGYISQLRNSDVVTNKDQIGFVHRICTPSFFIILYDNFMKEY